MAGFVPTPEMVDAVAEWRTRRPDDRRALLPCLQARFGVTAVEGVEIIRASNLRGVSNDNIPQR
ncbi:hypothetical protein ACWGTI_03385 [Mesorhizobium sp. ArgA1]